MRAILQHRKKNHKKTATYQAAIIEVALSVGNAEGLAGSSVKPAALKAGKKTSVSAHTQPEQKSGELVALCWCFFCSGRGG